ncbi:hypothetical protein K440DRAFT_645118 [Wilcoxina mikolae CBS 423.85]|nr:hypothetical protein K440DRAFT_645118 [Wilcoxina mikolae CBS 423.85]
MSDGWWDVWWRRRKGASNPSHHNTATSEKDTHLQPSEKKKQFEKNQATIDKASCSHPPTPEQKDRGSIDKSSHFALNAPSSQSRSNSQLLEKLCTLVLSNSRKRSLGSNLPSAPLKTRHTPHEQLVKTTNNPQKSAEMHSSAQDQVPKDAFANIVDDLIEGSPGAEAQLTAFSCSGMICYGADKS